MKPSLLAILFCGLSLNLFAQQHPSSEQIQQLDKLHLIIERSSIDSVKVHYAKIMTALNLPLTSLKLPDGQYHGESPYDDYNYKHEVTFEVKEGKLISVDYDEVHKLGNGKQNDTTYCKKMSVSGTTPAIAYPIYEKALLQTQNAEAIDAVSGASYSLYRLKLAIAYALLNGPH